jgi:hippurate hydrolase
MMTSPLALPALLGDAEALLPEIVEVRRRLHRRPEIGLDLPATQAVVVAELERMGLAPRVGKAVSSVTAIIEGARPGPTLVLRGDMDGLPLQEETGLEFSSEVPGAMHACGHDTHVAMLLGGARLLVARREQLAGRVLLMFQPGEEGFAGARFMLDEGLLDLPAAEAANAAFAIHISTSYPTGTLNLRPGPQMASADFIRLTVRGRGGHASAPYTALDPIPVAAEIVLALQTMVTRRIDVFDPAVVTITHIRGGTTNNIIPETVFLQGTIRTVSETTRAAVHANVRRVVEGICAAHGAVGELEIEPGYPVTVNDPVFSAFVASVGEELAGAEAVIPMLAPIMVAEDFSYVLQRVPGAMVFLGARPPQEDPATAPGNHSNKVVFHEPALALGAAMYAAVALRHLAAG